MVTVPGGRTSLAGTPIFFTARVQQQQTTGQASVIRPEYSSQSIEINDTIRRLKAAKEREDAPSAFSPSLRLPAPSSWLLFLVQLPQLHAAVLRTALIGVVPGDRLRVSKPLCLEP